MSYCKGFGVELHPIAMLMWLLKLASYKWPQRQNCDLKLASRSLSISYPCLLPQVQAFRFFVILSLFFLRRSQLPAFRHFYYKMKHRSWPMVVGAW